jgi:hypothetical protein
MYSPNLERFEDPNRPMRAIGSPLGIILNPSGDATAVAGGTFELSITVSNQGSESALINIYIDESSTAMRSWCASPYERLGLGPLHSREVVFRFEIPPDALPQTYDYCLVIDAPQHYPEDTPILHRARLAVAPALRETQTVSDATFSLQPATSSTQPLVLPPGEPLTLQAIVRNRSDRVDRFRLALADLESAWYRVIYPDSYTSAGMVFEAEGLELNPGDEGQITLLVTAPFGTGAGMYSTAVRLYSANDADLVLIDVAYFQVAPVYLLSAEMQTVVGKVRDGAGLFELRLHNSGNTVRHIALTVKGADEEDLCRYTLAPERSRIPPGQSATVGLQVEPTRKWRRPFYGKLISFVVEIEDEQDLPLTGDRYQGALMWEPRPWWQFLLLALVILTSVAALIFLIWWLFFRPPARPQIVEFAPDSTTYDAARGDAIRLNWTIAHPDKVRSLQLKGLSPDDVVVSGPIAYDLSDGVPSELQIFCTEDEAQLICQNVPTDARKPGDYVFELAMIPSSKPAENRRTSRTDTVPITPVPPSEIREFASSEPVYDPPPIPEDAQRPPDWSGIRLNWSVTQPTRIREIVLVGRSPDGLVLSPERRYDLSSGIPEALAGFCQLSKQELACQDVPTDATQPGEYLFEMTVVPLPILGQSVAPISQTGDKIKVNDRPVPIEIAEFTIDGEAALPKHIVQLQRDEPTVLNIAWTVEGGEDLTVELLPAPGNVGASGTVPYPLTPESSGETLTLQASNDAGSQIRRSVKLEVLPPPPLPPPPEPIPPLPVPPEMPPTAQDGAMATDEETAESAREEQRREQIEAIPDADSDELTPQQLPPQFR